MKYSRYEYKTEDLLLYFEFTSEGPKGTIRKLVEYSATTVENVYNLAFGDYDERIDGINDKSITNNGDSQKVLATVASTVYAFTGKYPNAWVHATGSTNVRTRLYRMGITNNLTDIAEDFYIFGLRDDVWEKFIVGEDYEAFMVTRKNKNISL
ncbi:MAG: hypothetical protein A2033_03370 [Bacteroidetes bacterium GWA2_31_9]|nr:MAG: hypothetical protein A2033_03370 [Bacteroidetes bacterium GWA2_31_9]